MSFRDHDICSKAIAELISRARQGDPEIEALVPESYRAELLTMPVLFGCTMDVIDSARFGQAARAMKVTVPNGSLESENVALFWKLFAHFGKNCPTGTDDCRVKIPNAKLKAMVRHQLDTRFGGNLPISVEPRKLETRYYFSIEVADTFFDVTLSLNIAFIRRISSWATIRKCPNFNLSPKNLFGILDLLDPKSDDEIEKYIALEFAMLEVLVRHFKERL